MYGYKVTGNFMETDVIREAVRKIRFNHVEPIKERVDLNAANKLNLARAIFKNTEVADLANYPKKPTTHF
jgi:hypothetical protein